VKMLKIWNKKALTDSICQRFFILVWVSLRLQI